MIDAVRRTLGVRRVGHTGTLDPFASGLLLVLTGRATRLAQFLVGLPKHYTGTIRLGAVTDTDDRTGAVLARDDGAMTVPDQRIRQVMEGLSGRQRQRPPAYSAKKTSGRRAYRLARHGEAVELPPSDVDVRRFEVLDRADTAVHFVAEVSSGTYLRALARDLGERLGCGAHLEDLRRTRVGHFDVAEAVPLAQLGQVTKVRPPLEAVPHLERRVLTDDERQAVTHGRAIPSGDVEASPVSLVSRDQLVAIAERAGDALKPRVVLADA